MDSFGLDSENKQDISSEVTEAVQSQSEHMDKNKISEDAMDSPINADSPPVLLGEISGGNIGLKDELAELKNIGSKEHDISNELKEMFEEKSSDIDELADSSLAKHNLDNDITKEDKLKDIVPDDILGKDDSFDGIDNETLNQDIQGNLTSEQPSETIANCLPDENVLEHESITKNEDKLKDDSITENEEINLGRKDSEERNESDQIGEMEITKHEESLNYNVPDNIGTKEIDEIIEQGMASDEDHVDKSNLAEGSSVCELGDDLENQLKHITGDGGDLSMEGEAEKDITNPVDKSSTIELNRENMMVEFAQDDSSGNQVLIQINTDQNERSNKEPSNSEGLVMKTSDGQTLVLTTENMNSENSEPDVASQVEGGADFMEAVTGKLEDVLKDTEKEISQCEELNPATPSIPISQEETVPSVKEDPPQCCVSNCKSGKSKLKTTFKFFHPPTTRILYKKWEYVFNQAKQTLTPDSLICELHFRTGLIYKKGTDKSGKTIWALKDAALPKLSQSGIIRVPSPNSKSPMAVQVTKKPDGTVSSPTIKSQVADIPDKNVGSSPPSRVMVKKVLQKPVKTVATKVSNEVTDIGFLYKNPELVKAAQEEMNNLDVLVCGECHSVFHILELFQAHKTANKCKGESNFKGNPSEPKPQVWAFLLWKSAQAKVADVESSWKLYQRWCKMDEKIRSVWIAAGKALQEGNAIASMKVSEVKPVTPTITTGATKRNHSSDDHVPVLPKKAKLTKQSEKGGGESGVYEAMDSYGEDSQGSNEQTLSALARHSPEIITSEVEIKQEVMSDDENGEDKENASYRFAKRNKQLSDLDDCSRCQKPITDVKGYIRCTICFGNLHAECCRLKTPKAISRLGAKKNNWICDSCKLGGAKHPKAEQMKPKDTDDNTDDGEFVVEKIVSRRYNIKKKHFEYLLKWEGYPPEQNTWEPAENLGTCQHLLKAFEEALAKQQAAKQSGRTSIGTMKKDVIKPPLIKKDGRSSSPIVGGRPVRSSKQKAMDQVRAWCGSMKPADAEEAVKRKAQDTSDSEFEEEVVVKRVKVEMESEDSDADGFNKTKATPAKRSKSQGPLTVKLSSGSKPMTNGDDNLAAALGLESDDDGEESIIKTTLSSSVLNTPVQNLSSLSAKNQKVLLSSAKSVVTVDPKRVPNLSSGVYIMSNKSGIIKVDSDQTISSLQKQGVLKKVSTGSSGQPKTPGSQPRPPVSAVKTPIVSAKPSISIAPKTITMPASPVKPSVSPVALVKQPVPSSSSGVVVLPRSEPGAPVQKGIVKKSMMAGSPSSPATGTPPTRPPGALRPAGALRPPTPNSAASPLRMQAGTPSRLVTGQKGRPPVPRPTIPIRGTPVPSPLLKRPLPESPTRLTSPSLSQQQKMLIAKKKAESEGLGGSPNIKPTIMISSINKQEGGQAGGVSSPKVLSHTPMAARGRGRGGSRGRGRGGASNVVVSPRQEPEDRCTPEVKETQLVEGDDLIMEFQEPLSSEESDGGEQDEFDNLEELPPISPSSPPRPLSLCPLTGKVLCKAEGEKTPEPTPPPSPKPEKPPTPTPPEDEEKPKGEESADVKVEEPTHILPDHEEEALAEAMIEPEPTPVAIIASPIKPKQTPVPITSRPAPAVVRAPTPASVRAPVRSHLRAPLRAPARAPLRAPVHGPVRTPIRSPVRAPVPKQQQAASKPIFRPRSTPAVTITPRPAPSTPVRKVTPPTTTTVVRDGRICKVEMSPGGTSGTLVEAVSAPASAASTIGVTEGSLNFNRKPRGGGRGRKRGISTPGSGVFARNRGPQLSVLPNTSTATSVANTIQVPARKLFQETPAPAEDDLVTITGEDGMVYQISNAELEAAAGGNTLMVTGEDGQQQCVYVTTEGDGGEEGTILTLDSAYADAVAQLTTDQVNILSTENGDQYFIKQGDGEDGQLLTLEGAGAGVEGEAEVVGDEGESGQVVAQLVEAGEPAPGGSRRVVLLLPDGNLMMTEVDEEQYAALDLDK